MGNCCLRRDSAEVWTKEDDDWVNVCELHGSEQPEKQNLLGEVKIGSLASLAAAASYRRGLSSSGGGDHQVKIKMTKRELEDLMRSGGGDMEVSSVEESLTRAINDGDLGEVEEEEDQRPWSPALQSIPEVD